MKKNNNFILPTWFLMVQAILTTISLIVGGLFMFKWDRIGTNFCKMFEKMFKKELKDMYDIE